MLTRAPVTSILPARDMTRARNFYEKTLGLEPKGFAACLPAAAMLRSPSSPSLKVPRLSTPH